jgi:hypothetical protein
MNYAIRDLWKIFTSQEHFFLIHILKILEFLGAYIYEAMLFHEWGFMFVWFMFVQ